MSIDLGRRLISAGVVPPDEVEAALFLSTVRGVPFARVLLDRGAVSERALEEELERVGGLGLRQVVALQGTAGLWSPKVLRAGQGAHGLRAHAASRANRGAGVTASPW